MQFLTFPITHTAGDAERLPGSWRGGKGIAVVVVDTKNVVAAVAVMREMATVAETIIVTPVMVMDHVVVVDNKEKEKVWWTRSPR